MGILPLVAVAAIAALALGGKKKRPAAPASLPPDVTPGVPQTLFTADMPLALKDEIAKVLRRLNVQSDGSVKGPITKEDIQVATALAGKLARTGYGESANKLRGIIAKASSLVPEPPMKEAADLPGLSPEMKRRINRALQLERDPTKLKELLAAVKRAPASGERDALITSIESLITQLEATASTAAALEATQQVMDAGAPSQASGTKRLALRLAKSLRATENRYSMPKAKRYRDVALIKQFQAAVSETPDGKPGVRTNFAMARLGVSTLPLVFYWPKRATRRDVAKYRAELNKLADYAQGVGQTARASALRASAQRERGQAGVIR